MEALKPKAKRVIGIDASTNSLAFAIFEDGEFRLAGEVKFKGSSPFERLTEAKRIVKKMVDAGYFGDIDFIAIESAIMVRNIQTAIDLAYVYGAIMGEMSEVSKELHKVAPITWQSAIGVPNLKKAEREEIQKEFPGKSKSWYQNKGRQIRKARIADFTKQFYPETVHNSTVITDNLTDAVGIAYYASTALTRR